MRVAGLVAHRLADFLTKQSRHARRRGTGGDAARLQQHDLLARKPGLVEQRQGNGRGLATPGRGREQRAAAVTQRGLQGGQGVERGIGGELKWHRAIVPQQATIRR